jgi:hypothetical protein
MAHVCASVCMNEAALIALCWPTGGPRPPVETPEVLGEVVA